MTVLRKSDSQLDAEAAGRVTTPCLVCGKPFLVGYPHRHETPPRPEYDPMPVRPIDRDAMVAIIRAEYYAELPHRLHVAYVPGRTEPVGVSEYSAGAAGYVPSEETVDALDTGELGSPSWSPMFHRRVGSVEAGDEMLDDDLAPFPWYNQLRGMRRWCASNHQAWYEHRGRPLCWILTLHHVLGNISIADAAQDEKVTLETAERLLFGQHGPDCPRTHPRRCPDGAIGKWWGWVSDDLNGTAFRRSPARMLTRSV